MSCKHKNRSVLSREWRDLRLCVKYICNDCHHTWWVA